MKLKQILSVELYPKPPFNFDATFHKPSHFPSNDNIWKRGVRWQTWQWFGKPLGLKLESGGSESKPKIDLKVYSKGKVGESETDSLIEEIRYKFNLDANLSDFNNKFVSDSILGSAIEKWKGMRLGHQGSLCEYIIIGIMLQNTTVKRSISMLQALFENFGSLLEFNGKKLWCFWPPCDLTGVPEKKLRKLKLGYRAKSIKRIDDQFAEGLVDEFELRRSDLNTQKEKLLELYGVGPATVWYLLFDIFHHWDHFEYISPWEQKIYSKLFFDRDPENPVSTQKLLKHFDRCRPFRRLAVHYIWEDLWWKRQNESIPWLEKLIRI